MDLETLMVLLQRLTCAWRTVFEINVFLCGGIMDESLE